MLKIAHHKAYIHPLPEGHRFPMVKYELIPEQLLYEGLVTPKNFFEPELASKETVCLAHDESYVESLLQLQLDAKMIRRIGFPLSQKLVDRERYIVDGTIRSAMYAQQFGISFNTAGGTHHAGFDFGEGFCLLNDQAVAASYLHSQHLADRILIIDLDVHQGNGTAHIFRDHSAIFTFSMHCDKNFPFVKERSYLDIPLEGGISDESYLAILRQHLDYLFEEINPDFVFYQAGVDILETDKLGKLKISSRGVRKRDQMILQTCFDRKIPIQISMGGGYSPHIKDIVNTHVGTFRTAIDIFSF